MECDVVGSTFWFRQHAAEVPVPAERLDGCDQVATDILHRLPLPAYLPGMTYYVWVSYLVALAYCSERNLANSEAEAIAFYLSQGLLEMAHIPQFLSASREDYFRRASGVVKPAPDIARHMLRWRVLWFADIHKLSGITRLWDAIIAADGSENYIGDLARAHLAQAGADAGLSTGWDVERIIVNAEKAGRVPTRRKKITALVLILICAAVFVLLVAAANHPNAADVTL